MKRKRSNSCGASDTSLDDSGLSGSEHSISGSSSPANADDIQVCDDEDETIARSNSYLQHQHEHQTSRMHLHQHLGYPHLIHAQHHPHHESTSIMQFRDSIHHQQSLMNLAFSYFNQRQPYQHQMYPQHQFHDTRLTPQSFTSPQTTSTPHTPHSAHHEPGLSVTAGSLHSPTSSVQSGRSDTHSPSSSIELSTTYPLAASSPSKPAAKKCGFSILAILGDR